MIDPAACHRPVGALARNYPRRYRDDWYALLDQPISPARTRGLRLATATCIQGGLRGGSRGWHRGGGMSLRQS